MTKLYCIKELIQGLLIQPDFYICEEYESREKAEEDLMNQRYSIDDIENRFFVIIEVIHLEYEDNEN